MGTLMFGWAIRNHLVVLAKNVNFKKNKRETALNETQLYLLTVQLEGPHHPKKGNNRTEAAAHPAAQGRGEEPSVSSDSSDCSDGGRRERSRVSHQISEEGLTHLCLCQGRGGKRIRNAGSFVESTLNQSSTATGLSQAGKGSVTTLSSSRPWRHPRGPEPPPGASLRSPTWSGRSRT